MNYGILRVEKIKLADGGGLRGRAMHDFRQFKSSQNERTHTNQYEGCKSYDELRAKADAMWATLDGKPRSDAVGLLEVMVTTTAGGIPEGKEDAFFADVRKEVEGWYGPENILAMAIHRDETTPHCHLFVMPITRKSVKKNRLSKEEKSMVAAGGEWPSLVKLRLDTKKLLNGRESLSALQTSFHSHVFKKYGLERGEPHIDGEKKKHNIRSSLKLKEKALAAERAAFEQEKKKEMDVIMQDRAAFERDKDRYAKDVKINEAALAKAMDDAENGKLAIPFLRKFMNRVTIGLHARLDVFASRIDEFFQMTADDFVQKAQKMRKYGCKTYGELWKLEQQAQQKKKLSSGIER